MDVKLLFGVTFKGLPTTASSPSAASFMEYQPIKFQPETRGISRSDGAVPMKVSSQSCMAINQYPLPGSSFVKLSEPVAGYQPQSSKWSDFSNRPDVVLYLSLIHISEPTD